MLFLLYYIVYYATIGKRDVRSGFLIDERPEERPQHCKKKSKAIGELFLMVSPHFGTKKIQITRFGTPCKTPIS